MKTCTRTFYLLFVALVFCGGSALAQSPVIFFTDLVNGPNTGGENNNGAIVTIYGKRFGASQNTVQGSVTVGGGAVAVYKLWSDTKISVAIGSAAATGNIVVHTIAGNSNGVSFTVRNTGNIYFVGPGGNNANAGTNKASPWADIYYAVRHIAVGDTVYFLDGYAATGTDTNFPNDNTSVYICGSNCGPNNTPSGTATNPVALVAYPGAVVTVGNLSGPNLGLLLSGQGSNKWWVVAGFVLRGAAVAVNVGLSNVRVIGNDMSCTNTHLAGPTGCMASARTSVLWVYGNNIHDAGSTNKVSSTMYFTTDSNQIDVGWNTFANDTPLNAIEVHSTGGHTQWDVHIHDNLIHDMRGFGINLATVDPNHTCSGDCQFGGGIEAYNNVFYNIGIGPDYTDGSDVSTQVAIEVGANGDICNGCPSGTGTVQIYNNTIYNCGQAIIQGSQKGAFAVDSNVVNIFASLRNNIIYQLSTFNEPYFTSSSKLANISGSNNLWFGNGPAPSQTTGNINVDPKFINTVTQDFHLQFASPAINAGLNIGSLAVDFDGITRPLATAAFDLGAYQFVPPNPIPALTFLSPASLTAGGAGFTLTVTGSGFVSASVVRWNGSSRTTTFVSATQLTALISASDIATSGRVQVTVFSPAAGGGVSSAVTFTVIGPIVNPGGTVSAAGNIPAAAASIASVYGITFASSTVHTPGTPLPTTLGGVSVRINGILAPLFDVSPTQINLQIPWEVLGLSQVSITVTSGGITSSPVTINLATYSPALFATNAQGSGQGAILIANTAFVAAPVGAFTGSRPANRGEFISIYCTGLGPVTNQPATGAVAPSDPPSTTTTLPTAIIGGISATVTFSGLAPGFVSLYQVNLQVPQDAPTGDAVPVVLSIGGAASNTVTIAVQ